MDDIQLLRSFGERQLNEAVAKKNLPGVQSQWRTL
jgi:hypothetical protein